MRSRVLVTALLMLAAGLAGAVVTLTLDRSGTTGTTTIVTTRAGTSQTAGALSVEEIAAAAASGVVNILATTTVETQGSPFAPPSAEEAVVSGSGIVLDRQGHVLTSEHVIENASTIHIAFADGRKVRAEFVASDPLLDLAVLSVKVPASTLHPLALGSADDLRLGDPIIAVGNPFGLERSVSVGIVSGLHRTMVAPNGFTVANALQTDAAINHGNSGGPLLDSSGKVVGIAAQIADSGVNANVGVAFAVSVDGPTRSAIATLTKGGTVSHAWLGISLDDIDAILATSGRVPVGAGALVTGIVAGGPAADAGLTGGSQLVTVEGASYCVGGDVITGVDGQAVASATDLQNLLPTLKVGEKVTLSVVHADGKKAELKLTLGDQPTTAPETTTGCG